MKKILACLLLLTMLTAMLPTVAAAEKFVENGYKYTVENGEATIVGCTELPDVLHIPETLGGYPVTTIAEDAIWFSTLREVYIPESIQRIGKQAFYSNAGMTVYLPDSNIMFESRPFAGASRVYAHITPQLEQLYTNDGALCSYDDFPCAPWELEPITESGLTYALYEGEAILLSVEDAENIEVPETLGGCPVTTIGSRCFRDVSWYANIVLPDCVRYIGRGALQNFYGFKLQKLPSSLEYIADLGLAEIDLVEQELPNSLHYIGDSAFSGSYLPNLKLNEGLEHIGAYAFHESVYELTDLTIPESVKYIGERAFSGAKLRLSVLTRDAECTDAFADVLWVRGYGESSVMHECGRAGVPFEDFETGERYEFSYKTTIDGMTYRVTEEYAELLEQDRAATDTIVYVPEVIDGKPLQIICSYAFDNDVIEAVFLPDTVEVIEDYAFDSCQNLYYIRMSESIRQIQQNAAYSCDKLSMIYLPPSFSEYKKTFGDKKFIFGYHSKSARVIGEEGSFAQALAIRFDFMFIKAREGYDYISLPSGVYETDGDTATMIAVSNNGSYYRPLTVPDEVFGVPITRIASGLIYPNADSNIGYESVVLGNNIVSVGEGAFSRSDLCYLHLGRNVQSLHYPLLKEELENVRIYGYTGTYAETFAKAHGYRFYPYDSSPFADVSLKAWYHDAVSFCYWRELMNGTSETTFEPKTKTTRAMLAQILYNLSGRPYLSWSYGFKDVDRYDWFCSAVNWCRYYGLAYGTTTWYFSPNDYVTREQVATFFYRYAKVCGLDVSQEASLNGYNDAWRVSDYAKSALQWAVANEIMIGNSPTTLNPKGYATRAELAMIIMNFANYVSAQ